jgi:hypothetical protein
MSQALDAICSSARGKLLRDGAGALGEAEWQLLRVSQLLNAAERGILTRMLADSPLAELLDVADALDAVGAPNAGQRLRTATEKLAVANDPGGGLRRAAAVGAVASLLGEEIGGMRAEIERRLMEFAARQRLSAPGAAR